MLNLLPPEIKEQRITKSRLYSVVLGYIVIGAIIGLGLAGLATWNFLQQSQIATLESQIQQLSSQRRTKEALITKASFIEDRLKAAPTLQEKRKWEEILNEIAAATPTDTKLKTIRVATNQTGKSIDLTLGGTTSDRRSIVLFRDKLEEAATISKATILSLSETELNGVKSFTFSLSSIYEEAKEATQ